MKTLNIIQRLSRIGRILSKIMFIFCIIGFCGCIVGILSMALSAPTLKIGGVTLESILSIEAGVTTGTAYVAMTAGVAAYPQCLFHKLSAVADARYLSNRQSSVDWCSGVGVLVCLFLPGDNSIVSVLSKQGGTCK